jgi:hypothetical protein
MKAVLGQESGGNYQEKNKDSGAVGAYQVMPANIPQWTKEAFGQPIDENTFRYGGMVNGQQMSAKQIQDTVASNKLNQYFAQGKTKYGDDATAVRYAASAWYSGSGDNMNSMKPQNGYPSIKDYTFSVLGRYQRQSAAA